MTDALLPPPEALLTAIGFDTLCGDEQFLCSVNFEQDYFMLFVQKM